MYEGDEFAHLILSAPTVDISNIDATKVTSEDNIEVYKQKIAISCENMLTTANQALLTQPQLQSVVIMEHLPRFDLAIYDPTGLKAKLAKFANSTLSQLLNTSENKKKIKLGKLNMECTVDKFNNWYKDGKSNRYDGVHLYGMEGRDALTKNVQTIIQSVLPSQLSSTPYDHTRCPQTLYQRQQAERHQRGSANRQSYAVPVNNRFSVLGN